jgi:hypothetical protein
MLKNRARPGIFSRFNPANLSQLTGTVNVLLLGYSVMEENDEALIQSTLETYFANALVVNGAIGQCAVCQAADSGLSRYLVNSAINGDGITLTAAYSSMDTVVDASEVTHVILQICNQDAGKIVDATITQNTYNSSIDYLYTSLSNKFPNANLMIYAPYRRGTDVSESVYQAIFEYQKSKFTLLGCDYDQARRDAQHKTAEGITNTSIRIAKDIAALEGKLLDWSYPQLSAGTHTVNTLTIPISGTSLTGEEQIKVFSGNYDSGTEYSISSLQISNGNLLLTTDFADGNLPESSLTVYSAPGQVLNITNGGTNQIPSNIIKASNGLPLLRGSTTSTPNSTFGTLKDINTSCVMDICSSELASYPTTGTILRDMISGKQFTLSNFSFSNGELTSTGTAFATDSLNQSVALLNNLNRTDSSIDFTIMFDITLGALNGANQYVFANTPLTAGGGWAIARLNTAANLRFYQQGDTQNQFVSVGTYGDASTDMILAIKGNMSANTISFAVNSDTFTTSAFTARTSTANASVTPRIFASTSDTLKPSSGSELRSFALFNSRLSDSEMATIRAQMIARRT